MAAGAHGLLIEVHTHPETAYSDARQTIDVETFSGVVRDTELLRDLEPLFEWGAADGEEKPARGA
jgi:3-deoxy-7-phosphoheptulonate synthase